MRGDANLYAPMVASEISSRVSKSRKRYMGIIIIKHYDLITPHNRDVNSRITLTLELHNTNTLGGVDELKPQVT